MIHPDEALSLILSHSFDFGIELIDINIAKNRILAEDIFADRDFPPFDRVSMDGIAIDYASFAAGNRSFAIESTQYAGETPVTLSDKSNCIEIMTGAVLPNNCNTVIRYEDVEITENNVLLNINSVLTKQNIHAKGMDKKQGELLIPQNTSLNASHISVLATVGKKEIMGKKLPKIAIISTGDELVGIDTVPQTHQIRRSNNYSIKAVLEDFASIDSFHLEDDLEKTSAFFKKNMSNYDIFILSGGVSMGKKDFVIDALKEAAAEQILYKVAQKPGKPMWVGKLQQSIVFALPGNPCSTFMCLHKYVLPFIAKSAGIAFDNYYEVKLGSEITFKPQLHYYIQSKILYKNGEIWAYPIENNGSGDFFNLCEADGFLEINKPEEGVHLIGTLFKFIPFHKKSVLF